MITKFNDFINEGLKKEDFYQGTQHKVKVLKCDNKNAWYCKNINDEFIVVDDTNPKQWEDGKERWKVIPTENLKGVNYILKDDCSEPINEGFKDTIKNFINPSEEKKIENIEKRIEGLTRRINKMSKLIDNPDDFIADDPFMEYIDYCLNVVSSIKDMGKKVEGIEKAEDILRKFVNIAINKIVTTFPEDITKYKIDNYTKNRIKEMLMDVDDICQDYNINFFKRKGIKI